MGKSVAWVSRVSGVLFPLPVLSKPPVRTFSPFFEKKAGRPSPARPRRPWVCWYSFCCKPFPLLHRAVAPTEKKDHPLLPHPPRPSDPSHCSPGGPGSDKHPPRPRQMRCRTPAPRAMWFHRRPTTSGRHRAGRVAAGPGQPCGPGCNPGTPAGGRGAPWRAHTPGPAGRSDRGADGPRAAVVVEAWVAWAIAGRGEATQVHRGQSFRPSANPLLVRPLRQKKTGDSRAAVPGFNGQKP